MISAPPPAQPALSASRRLTLRTLVAGTLLGAMFVLGCVQWSLAHGRLSQDPTFDDSFYLWEGGHVLNTFFRSGAGAFLHELVQHPPHSPFSTLGAALAFAVFGLRDWAPYVLINGGVLLAFLACIAYLARALSLRWRLLAMGLALTLPLAVVAVHDYRPDFANALLTAGGVYLVLETAGGAGDDRARVRRWAGAGVAFGLALVTKPSFFLHTLFIEGASLGFFAGLLAVFARPFSPGAILRQGARALGWVVVPSLLVAAPYYIVNAHETYQYFVDRSVGKHGGIWTVPGGIGGLVWYNTFGLAGTTMFGGAFYVVALLALGALAALAWRRRWHELALAACLAAVGALSIAVMVAGKLPNPFFPLTCYLLLVFAAWRAIFTALADFLPTAGDARRWPAVALGAVLLLAGAVDVSLLRLGRIWIHDNPSVRSLVGHGNSYNERILRDMEHEMGFGAVRATTPLPTFITAGGFINATTLRWLAQRDNLPFEVFEHELSSVPEEFAQGLRQAAFVIAPQAQTSGVFLELPSWTLQPQVARMIAAEVAAGRLRLLRSYPTQDGGAYQLFISDAKTAEWTAAFSPVETWDGFLNWEGPYPESHLGRVRWETGQHSRLTFPADAPGHALLRFSVRADQPVRATVSVNGTAAATVDLPGGTGFHDYRVPVETTINPTEVTFDLEQPPLASPDGTGRALLFRQLELIPGR